MKHSHTAFFGDSEHTFCLTAPMLLELERSTGAGIGALSDRIFKRQFAHTDLSDVIRLSLIGGGMNAKRANEMIATYVTDRPIAEVHPLARDILLARWLGNSEDGNG